MGRITREAFLSKVKGNLKTQGVEIDMKTLRSTYNAMIDALLEFVEQGDIVLLSGFGKFEKKIHRGHRVQFSATGEDANRFVKDYQVLKFTPARKVKRGLT